MDIGVIGGQIRSLLEADTIETRSQPKDGFRDLGELKVRTQLLFIELIEGLLVSLRPVAPVPWL